MQDELAQRAALELLRGARPTPAQLQELFERARQPDYWRTLNPALSVGGGRLVEVPATAPAPFDAAVESFRRQGWFLLPGPVISPAVREAMHSGIRSLRSAGWPAVFSWVYDEFWSVARSAPIRALLLRLLESSSSPSAYQQLPHIWTHDVAPHRGSAGWRPHKDGNNAPGRVTLWFALTDARLDNGCIYVVPRDRLPPALSAKWFGSDFAIADVQALLHATLAAPAPAGALLGWDHDLIHWGSPATPGAPARVSVSMEFASSDAGPFGPDDLPLIDPVALPDFELRLAMIARAIATYQNFDPAVAPYAPLARNLIAGDDRQATP